MSSLTGEKLPLAVLISGNGSNLQAIIDAVIRGDLNTDIRIVISNKEDAYGLTRAQSAGIITAVVDHLEFGNRDAYDQALITTLEPHRPKLIALAGFMRILGSAFCEEYHNRIMNIHPSLLPKYPGINTHQRALDANDNEHGASVHFVTSELDAGPLIIQGRTTIEITDTKETLQQKVHQVEHTIYPTAIRWFAENRLTVENNRVLLDGAIQPEQGINKS